MTATQANIPLLAVLALAAAGCRTVPKRSSAEPCPVAVADAGVAPHPVVILAEADGNANSYREYLLANDLSEIASVPTPVPPTKDIVRETVAPAEASPKPFSPQNVDRPSPLPVGSGNSPVDRKEVREKSERHWKLPCLVGLAIGGDAQFPDERTPIVGASLSLCECDRGDVFGLAACGGVGEYDKLVGASVSGFVSKHETVDGISVAGLGVATDDCNGIEASFGVNLNDKSVRGIQLAGLWNESRDVEGIQLAGLFNFGRLAGIQVSLFANDATPFGPIQEIGRSIGRAMCGLGHAAWTKAASGTALPLPERKPPPAESRGIQLAACSNVAECFSGLQAGLGFNFADDVSGIQIAFVRNEAERVRGVQFALVGNVAAEMEGLQFAAFNRTDVLHGVQAGLFNRAQGGAGVQIGLVNGFGAEGDATWNPLINIRF